MAAHRGHAPGAAFGLWLLVLGADVAAGGSALVIALITVGGVLAVAGAAFSRSWWRTVTTTAARCHLRRR